MRTLLACVAALVVGCQPRTEIVLGFATDFKAPVPLDEIQLDVIRQDGFPEGGDGLTWSISGAPGQPYDLPASYGIYSDGDDVQLDVTLSGLSGGSAIVAQTVTLSLVSGQTLFYRMGLTSECTNTSCGQMTCIEGTCVDPEVLVHQLPTYSPELVDELTCIPPVVQYVQTADGSPMPFSADAASCPPDLCVQGLCLNPPGNGGGGGSSADTYLKPGNVAVAAFYGELNQLAMSADGNTLVLGSEYDSLGGQGVDPDESSQAPASNAGGVYVFERTGGTWTQSAYLKSSNDEGSDFFGAAVAISGDGGTIAIGEPGESSDAVGIGGDQTDNSVQGAGAVYVFSRSGSTWTQSEYLKAQLNSIKASFGRAVALSGDGTTLAVGDYLDPSSTTGTSSTPNTTGLQNGSVYVFTYSGGAWAQQAYLKPNVTHQGDDFGIAVALSQDGNTLAAGAYYESSSATGVNGDASLTDAMDAGAAYVFTRTGSAWTQDAYIKASNAQANTFFGEALALSAAGDELAVGSPRENSAATGIGGNQSDTSAMAAGAAYVFALSAGAWSQQAYLKASNTAAKTGFGIALSLSGDGHSLAVGSFSENGGATGLDGNQTDTSAMASGAAYIFTQSAGTWSQQHYVKASNSRTMDYFGYSTAMSSDGSIYAIGAPGDSSAATGVDGDQTNTSAANEGAAYVFPP